MLNGKVSRINFGSIEFDALLSSEADSKGKPRFYVGVSQASTLFQLRISDATRNIKALLGKDFQLLKMRTDLNPKAVNVITLSQFETVQESWTRKATRSRSNS